MVNVDAGIRVGVVMPIVDDSIRVLQRTRKNGTGCLYCIHSLCININLHVIFCLICFCSW